MVEVVDVVEAEAGVEAEGKTGGGVALGHIKVWSSNILFF